MGTSYQYDALGRVIRITHADGTYQSTAYGFAHKVVTDERGNSTTYNYRGYGDPEKLSLMSFQPSDPAASITLTRNSREQVTSVTQGNFTRHYGYNANGYLISVSNPETGDTVYGRDIAGNMTSKQVGQSDITTYTYDGQNRQTAIDYAQGTPAIKNTYDNKIIWAVSEAECNTRLLS
ncbi:hypothetical protein [Pseudomonas avellanae]|uniref:hypothetical protein n=1 Tax=Pseudomonas avellanae TaxID=46257 RepID=UPI000AB4DA81|nr:hypothetical protein [Pseudomonas avellanae]